MINVSVFLAVQGNSVFHVNLRGFNFLVSALVRLVLVLLMVYQFEHP